MRLLALLALFSVSLVVAPPAAADCIGPSITISDGSVRRGETIRVVGEGWGDNCYDMGLPPDAHGTLGNPLDDIVIAFVQDGKETVVGRGSADGDYRFQALVTLPSGLQPGTARLVARSGEYGAYERPSLVVSTATPVAAEGPAVRHFHQPGTSSSRETEPARADDANATDRGWLIGGVLAVLVAAVGLLIFRRARSAMSP